MSSTVDVDALVGWHITFHALPAAVALAAAVRVLAVSVAKNRTGSWNTKQQERALLETDCLKKLVTSRPNQLQDSKAPTDISLQQKNPTPNT